MPRSVGRARSEMLWQRRWIPTREFYLAMSLSGKSPNQEAKVEATPKLVEVLSHFHQEFGITSELIPGTRVKQLPGFGQRAEFPLRYGVGTTACTMFDGALKLFP